MELLEAHLIELAAWERGDYLLVANSTVDGYAIDPDTGQPIKDRVQFSEERTVKMRFVFDFPEQRFLFLRVIESEQHLLNSDGKEVHLETEGFPAITERVTGLLNDPEKGLRVTKLGKRAGGQVSMDGSLPFLLRAAGGIDLRFAGIQFYDHEYQENEFERWTDLVTNSDRIRGASQVGKGKRRISLVVLQKNGEDKTFMDVDLTEDEFTPTQMATFSRGETILSPRRARSVEKVEWEKVNGINVPVKVKFKRTRSRRIAGQRMICDFEGKVRIDWRSINSQLDDGLFDARNIEEPARMRALLLPDSKDN